MNKSSLISMGLSVLCIYQLQVICPPLFVLLYKKTGDPFKQLVLVHSIAYRVKWLNNRHVGVCCFNFVARMVKGDFTKSTARE